MRDVVCRIAAPDFDSFRKSASDAFRPPSYHASSRADGTLDVSHVDEVNILLDWWDKCHKPLVTRVQRLMRALRSASTKSVTMMRHACAVKGALLRTGESGVGKRGSLLLHRRVTTRFARTGRRNPLQSSESTPSAHPRPPTQPTRSRNRREPSAWMRPVCSARWRSQAIMPSWGWK